MARQVLRVDNSRVGYAELFFDLVFVFAITQVSHHLLYHYTLAGAAETALLFLAVWWVWIYTTWVLNWLDPETTPVRMLLFAMMTAGLFLSMAIPTALGDRGLVFAGAYVAMQIGRTIYMLWVVWSDLRRRQTYYRIATYFAVAAVFWIWGALVEDHALRLSLWVLALGIEFLGPAASYRVPGLGRDQTTSWRVSGAHMAERCGLFVIICLGETLLISGATFAGMDWDVAGLLAFLASVLGTGGMWWVYFHIGHRRGAHQIEHAEDTGAIARRSYTYYHIPIVAGVVLSAVGAERAIAHPEHLATFAEGASVIGGLALFLFGNGLFKRASSRWFPLSHLVGLGLCAVVFLAGPWMTLLVQNLLAALILILVAVWEHRSLSAANEATA
ncbi:low temperature requirement protein A [Tabrizicola sp.]|uniref:low temperature requirement protein A n=1 Tax=Tabrizicola sp. TaxID=2005166 RepID=UPI003F2AD0F7